jgi:serine/threonine-protein kinase
VALAAPRIIGRYTLCGDIAAGGMATVHYGRLLGPAGFSRTVAIKRLHAQFARDPEFVSMFMDEARVAARIHHPNVVQTLDVVALEGELFLVMDYVPGESLSRLLRAQAGGAGGGVPLGVVSAIACGALHGLHAAHQATSDTGEPLGIVHRDISPQNVLVGSDGIPRVLDFGVAKAAGRVATTREGQLKGKFAYMAPEQVRSGDVDRRTDVYALGVVLWEMLTLHRLFKGDNDAQLLNNVLRGDTPPPSALVPGLPKEIDQITLKALAQDPAARFQDAREMALALEAAVPVASSTRLAMWVEGLAGKVLAERAKSVAQIESHSSSGPHKALQDMLRESVTPTPAPAQAPMLEQAVSWEPKSGVAMSQATTPESPLDPKPSRPSRGLFYGALLVLALGGAAFAGSRILSRPLSTDEAAPQAARTAPVAATTTSAPSSAPLPSTAVDPTAAASGITAAPSAAASAIAPPAPSDSAAPRASAQARMPRAPFKPKPGPAAASDPGADPGRCTIKSFVDESGIEHFVKECK